jgi:hypothetical protein
MFSIFKEEFHLKFDKICQNNIYDNIIKNNFKDFNNILPMDNQKIFIMQ